MLDRTSPRPCCPTCGHAIESARMPVEMLPLLNIGGKRREFLDALVRAYPSAVTHNRLVDELYGMDPNGGPLATSTLFNVMSCQLRQIIGPLGWTIPKEKPIPGAPASRRLAPIGAA